MRTEDLREAARAAFPTWPDDGVQIVRAVPGQAESLRALHELSLATLAGEVYSPEQIRGLLAVRDTAPEDMLSAGRMSIARRHGAIVGSAGWEPDNLDGRPIAQVRSVFVHPSQTRRGIASALVRAVEADAMQDGICRFTLSATLNAVPLYRRLGYLAGSPAAIDIGDGLAFPVVPMQRTIFPWEAVRPRVLFDTDG